MLGGLWGMRLITAILTKKLELYQDFELNKDYLRSVWHFYFMYNLALAITGIEDPEKERKNKLVSKLISETELYHPTYQKILSYMKKDMQVINLAFEMLEQIKDEGGFMGDYFIRDALGVSVYD